MKEERFHEICSLVDDGILTIKQASDRRGMEPEMFFKDGERINASVEIMKAVFRIFENYRFYFNNKIGYLYIQNYFHLFNIVNCG